MKHINLSQQQLMSQLIATPSISSVSDAYDSGNIDVIHLLAEWLEQLGFSIHIQHLAHHPEKANLIATLGNQESNDGLILSGHTDTVPCNPDRWQSDPFKLEQRDNRFYGLGTTDMKGFFAVVIEAIRQFDANQFKHPLTVVATADEESTMSGAKALLDQIIIPGKHVIIGEATELHPIHAHKGMMMDGIRLIGKAGHSSDPRHGVNAMEGMVEVISALMKWRKELQQEYANHEFEVPYPTLNFGHIKGGDSPNRICGECELQIDLRPLPGMSIEELRNMLKERVTTALTGSKLQFEHQILFDGAPPLHTSLQSDIVQSAEKFSGYKASTVAYSTEGPFFNQMGKESIIMGPGSIQQAHQPNEYVSMEQITLANRLFSQMIHHFCIDKC